MDRLGLVLIKRKQLRLEQLEEGLDSQILNGGRLGTNLIELGHISEAQLADALQVQHGVPTAHGEISPHPAALDAIRPELCDRYNLIPLRLEGARLYIGVVAPFSPEQLAELSRRLGRSVGQMVIPEFRLHQLLRRYAKAFRPIRAVDLSHGPSAAGGASTAERTSTELISEEEFQTLYAKAMSGGRLNSPEQVSAEHDVYVEAPHRPSTESGAREEGHAAPGEHAVDLVLAQAITADVEDRRRPGGSGEAPFLDRRTAIETLEPMSFAEAQAALANIADRHGVALVIMRFAASKFSRALLMALHGDAAIGWAGFGPGIQGGRARRIAVPLTAGSPFRLVRDSRSQFLGPMHRDLSLSQFFKAIGGAPQTALLMPILARGRVVNILYADHGPDEPTQPDIAELMILSQKVGRSYEAMLARRKAEQGGATPL